MKTLMYDMCMYDEKQKSYGRLEITLSSTFEEELETSNNMGVNETCRRCSLHSWAIYSKTVSPIKIKVTLNERGQKYLRTDV